VKGCACVEYHYITFKKPEHFASLGHMVRIKKKTDQFLDATEIFYTMAAAPAIIKNH
jgi:hypothetical protein